VTVAEFADYKDLFSGIKTANVSLDSCSDPGQISDLPFPFLGGPYPKERFPLKGHCFRYMGREKFAALREGILDFEEDDGYRKLYLYGTIGYGKSYMLAALACLLIKEGKRVVFLPDCRGMLENHGRYLTSALLLCFGDSPIQQREIKSCRRDPNKLIELCAQLSDNRILLYFVIDQYNALDLEEENKDSIGNDVKRDVRKWLDMITFSHCTIKSASANYKAAMHMQQKHRNEMDIAVYGGFTKARRPPFMP
jgi:hypothetical protein